MCAAPQISIKLVLSAYLLSSLTPGYFSVHVLSYHPVLVYDTYKLLFLHVWARSPELSAVSSEKRVGMFLECIDISKDAFEDKDKRTPKTKSTYKQGAEL